MEWTYYDTVLDYVPIGFIGFVYRITFEDGLMYIGKKNFFSERKRNFGKKELALITDKRLKKYEIVRKESDWRAYVSSNPIVKSKIKAKHPYKKEILCFAKAKKHLTYLEEELLYKKAVLWDDTYINDNIGGKFFTKDVLEWESKKS